MHSTVNAYLDNFATVKGEKYAIFMQDAARLLFGGNVLNNAFKIDKAPLCNQILSDILAAGIEGFATKAGVPMEEIIPALNECKVMMKAIERVSEMPKEVV